MKTRGLLFIGLFALALAACPFTSSAQEVKTNVKSLQENLNKVWSGDYLQNKFSGLNLSRFSMRQSYSMMYVSGSQGRGNTYSMYTNVLTYKISDPLQVKFKVGYVMEPFSSQRMKGGFTGGQFFPGVILQYKPFKNMYLNFRVERYSGYSPSSYYSPFYMDDGIGRMFDSNP